MQRDPDRVPSCVKWVTEIELQEKGRNGASMCNDIIIDFLGTGDMLWVIFPASGKTQPALQASLWIGHPQFYSRARHFLSRGLMPFGFLCSLPTNGEQGCREVLSGFWEHRALSGLRQGSFSLLNLGRYRNGLKPDFLPRQSALKERAEETPASQVMWGPGGVSLPSFVS